MTSSPILWRGQADAFTSLLLMGDLYFKTAWFDVGPLKPRFKPLVIGKSGVGKTFVIKNLADELGLKCLRLSPANWCPVGGRSTPTLLIVHQFISDNENGILHIDEIDKARSVVGGSEWTQAVLNEIFTLLDGEPSATIKGHVWSQEMLRKARQDFLWIGSGTWESLWQTATQSKVGFGSQDGATQIVSNVMRLVRTNDAVAPELLNRFSQLIVIPPATEAELRDTAEKLGLTRLSRELRMPLDFTAGCQSGQGMRWLETEMLQLLLQARQTRPDLLRLRKCELEPDEEEVPDFGADDDDEPVL